MKKNLIRKKNCKYLLRKHNPTFFSCHLFFIDFKNYTHHFPQVAHFVAKLQETQNINLNPIHS